VIVMRATIDLSIIVRRKQKMLHVSTFTTLMHQLIERGQFVEAFKFLKNDVMKAKEPPIKVSPIYQL